MVIVIECEACRSRYRVAKTLFKKSKAISVRCRKCGECIVVEAPKFTDVEKVSDDFSQSDLPLSETEQKPESTKKPDRVPSSTEANDEERQGLPASKADDAPREMIDLLKDIDMGIPEVLDTPFISDTLSANADLSDEIGMAASEASDTSPAPDTSRTEADSPKEIDVAAPKASDTPPASDTSSIKADPPKEIDAPPSKASDTPPAPDNTSRIEADSPKEIDVAAPKASDTPPASGTSNKMADLLKEIEKAAPEASDSPSASDKSRIKTDLPKEIGAATPKASDSPSAYDTSRMKADLFKETDVATPKASDSPSAYDTSRMKADLFKEIDVAAPKASDLPPAALPKENVPASVSQPPKFPKPKDQGGDPPRHDEPVKSASRQEPIGDSGALASLLEDRLETQSPEVDAAPPSIVDKQPDPLPPEPRQRVASQTVLALSARLARSKYMNLRFLFILLLWILLLTASTLFFGTNYFERWFFKGESRQPDNVFSEQSVKKAAFEIQNTRWFSERMSGDKVIFAVTGTVTNRGNPVPWIQIRATIAGKDDDVLMEKSVVAGNQLDNTLLRTMSQEQIEAHLLKRNVTMVTDHDVPTGLTLPFMAVFFNPPKMVHAVTVKANAGEDK